MDTVAALCIGWRNVPHIVNSSKVGLGIADIDRINVIGNSIENIAIRLRSKWVLEIVWGKSMEIY